MPGLAESSTTLRPLSGMGCGGVVGQEEDVGIGELAGRSLADGNQLFQVSVNVAAVLKTSDKYLLPDPHDFFGKPILWGSCKDGRISVPVGEEFAAVVLVKSDP